MRLGLAVLLLLYRGLSKLRSRGRVFCLPSSVSLPVFVLRSFAGLQKSPRVYGSLKKPGIGGIGSVELGVFLEPFALAPVVVPCCFSFISPLTNFRFDSGWPGLDLTGLALSFAEARRRSLEFSTDFGSLLALGDLVIEKSTTERQAKKGVQCLYIRP